MMTIKLLVVDVDGTLTDGGIYYDENGNELKKFCTRDAAGFFAAHKVGIKIMILTGRESKATIRRMSEMKIEYLYQNINDKASFLETFMEQQGIKKEEVGYIGDDLNDFPSMLLTGFKCCPADSCMEIKEIADYISDKNGGDGVVRDVIEHILRKSGQWSDAVSDVYGIGS